MNRTRFFSAIGMLALAVLVGALSGFGLMGLAGCIVMAVLVVWCGLVGWLLFV